MDTITPSLKFRPAAAVAAVVIILAALLLAAVVEARALDAAAAWSAPRPSVEALDAPAYLPIVAGGRPPGQCDPSYPTVCIPPPPPDLDCPQVLPLVNFPTLPPDPHGFDMDGDGIGCESP